MRYVHSAWGVGEDKILLHTSQVALLKETKSQFYAWNIRLGVKVMPGDQWETFYSDTLHTSESHDLSSKGNIWENAPLGVTNTNWGAWAHTTTIPEKVTY